MNGYGCPTIKRACSSDRGFRRVDDPCGRRGRAEPPADRELVPLAALEGEALSCDAAIESERCAMLGALFQHGEVTGAEFPRSVRTIFD